MLFISPPFGNYIHLPNIMSIKGSYTLEPRYGLIQQILKTFRYSFKHKGWVNKIGLRNKGLKYGIKNYRPHRDILSIAILNKEEIPKIVNILPEETNIELNISCPNINKSLEHSQLSLFLNPKRQWCIIKLSPLADMKLVDKYYQQGFRQFHCSNTISIDKGGLSGTAIIPHTSYLLKMIKTTYNNVEIIAGGGIYHIDTYNLYKKLGANHYSISTLFLHPIKLSSFLYAFYYKTI